MRLAAVLVFLSMGCAAKPCDCVRPRAPQNATGIHAIDPPALGFFAKGIDADGIPIEAHLTVSDEALVAARERLERMIAKTPRLRANLRAAKFEMHVIGRYQHASDVPHGAAPFASCGEADLFDRTDDPCTLELAQALKRFGLE